MRTDRRSFDEQQSAAAAAVQAGLGETPAEFDTAGQLAALMARLPADTPVSIAETVRMDPGLDLGTTPNHTAAVATMATLVDPDQPVDVVEQDGTVRYYGGRPVPGVELGAVIVAEGCPVPKETIAFPSYERALDALGNGDLHVVLALQVQVLTWIASTLTAEPKPGDDPHVVTMPQWTADTDLRERMASEAAHLRQAAARLDDLHARVAAHHAAAMTRGAVPTLSDE